MRGYLKHCDYKIIIIEVTDYFRGLFIYLRQYFEIFKTKITIVYLIMYELFLNYSHNSVKYLLI